MAIESHQMRVFVSVVPHNYADFFMKRVEAGEKSGSTVGTLEFQILWSRGALLASTSPVTRTLFNIDLKIVWITAMSLFLREENRMFGDEEKAAASDDNDYRFKRLRELGLM